MKTLRLALILVFLSFTIKSFAQPFNFTATPNTVCENGIITASVDVGTLIPISYTWSAFTSTGVVNANFSSPTSQTTTITFPSAGAYSVMVYVAGASNSFYAINGVTVQSGPSVSVVSTHSTVCPGQSATLTALGTSGFT